MEKEKKNSNAFAQPEPKNWSNFSARSPVVHLPLVDCVVFLTKEEASN